MRLTPKVFAVVGLLFVSSCWGSNNPSSESRLGIRLDGTSLNLRFLACVGEDVTSAELFRSDGDNVIGENGDVLLWEISGPDLVPLADIGVVPQLNGHDIELDQNEEYFVRVKASLGDAYSSAFRLDDFVVGMVRVHESNHSEADFVRKATESC